MMHAPFGVGFSTLTQAAVAVAMAAPVPAARQAW